MQKIVFPLITFAAGAIFGAVAAHIKQKTSNKKEQKSQEEESTKESKIEDEEGVIHCQMGSLCGAETVQNDQVNCPTCREIMDQPYKHLDGAHLHGTFDEDTDEIIIERRGDSHLETLAQRAMNPEWDLNDDLKRTPVKVTREEAPETGEGDLPEPTEENPRGRYFTKEEGTIIDHLGEVLNESYFNSTLWMTSSNEEQERVLDLLNDSALKKRISQLGGTPETNNHSGLVQQLMNLEEERLAAPNPIQNRPHL